ncbi:sugar-binding domain-containing protein [Paenibacillus sp. HB172176]|uniref:sugar-binding domain-containing protein n=1 Tax=Paenibacillus sp. HB172176 TaxID=2493690 RepID=UPI001438D3A8|nr:sugar-binding domain-containing protein [Paenibacillus sp. HB172176]
MSQFPKVISLDGQWQFAYTPYEPGYEGMTPPSPDKYDVMMPVPGYWDDYTDRLKFAEFWSRDSRFNPVYRSITIPSGTGSPPDTSLPFLLGAGWYKKQFVAGADWPNGTVTLHVGGVSLEAWVWLNQQWIGHHVGHQTPFEMRLGEHIKPGGVNELLIVVANTREDIIGCSIRGFAGKSAGIYRSVSLKVAGQVRISDCYIHAGKGRKSLSWEVGLEGDTTVEELDLDWEVSEQWSGKVVASGRQAAKPGNEKWTTDSFDMKEWSDRQPLLYRIKLILRHGQDILDKHEQSFGLRTIERSGIHLRLNGKPVMLRGLTDHAYFPETCTPQTDIHFYRMTLKKLLQLGFNWIRFHTWAPPEECLQAADELGMMLQVEAANGFTESEWLDILRICRKHPSVVVYCCGNEVALDDKMLAYLERMKNHLISLVPDALFNPIEGLRSIEYEIDETAEGYVTEPFPHNSKRLERLKTMADVLSPHGAKFRFSYHSMSADELEMKRDFQVYERPFLIHELGINDTYLNLDLEHRYEGTRIGTSLYSEAREYIEEMGLLHMASIYYQHSCRWMLQVVKNTIENARKNSYITGYDLLGAIDCHWHRTGYPVGLLNEFYELKPGLTAEKLLQFNGESVLLANCGHYRNIVGGESLNLTLSASLYGQEALRGGHLSWVLRGEDHTIYARGNRQIGFVDNGQVTEVAKVTVLAPELTVPRKLIFEASLTGGDYQVNNAWEYWAFPSLDMCDQEISSNTRVLDKLDEESIAFMAGGGNVLLVGSGPFVSLPTTFQIMTGGRVQGNNATVIREHPIFDQFPHEGFCDWQFYRMVEGAETIVFDDISIPFDPIVEFVSGYKMIRKQSSLFELTVGEGRLLVCTLQIDEDDCGARFLYHHMLQYIDSGKHVPAKSAVPEALRTLIAESRSLEVDFSTDEGFDVGGHVSASNRN